MTRNVILYIALSLDGYIAGADGGVVDWLDGSEEDYQEDAGYSAFLSAIDSIIMGYATYRQITTELSPDEWPYADKTSYVLTHRALKDTDEIKFVNRPAADLAAALKEREGKNIWVCGGADTAHQLIEKNLIDEYHLTVMPLLLGNGIRLFRSRAPRIPLELTASTVSNGILTCIYRKKNMPA